MSIRKYGAHIVEAIWQFEDEGYSIFIWFSNGSHRSYSIKNDLWQEISAEKGEKNYKYFEENPPFRRWIRLTEPVPVDTRSITQQRFEAIATEIK